MSAEAQLKHIKELAVARQERYLSSDENKKKHAERNRISYLKRKEKLKGKENATVAPAPMAPAPVAKANPAAPKPKANPAAPKPKAKALAAAPAPPVTKRVPKPNLKNVTPPVPPKKTKAAIKRLKIVGLEPVTIKDIKQWVAKQKLSETYITSANRIFLLFGETDMVKVLNREDLVPKITDEERKKSGELVSVNTKIADLNFGLKIADSYTIPILKHIRDAILKAKKIWGIKSADEANEPNPNVIPWTEYLDKVESTFTKDSKEFVIATLYHEVPARDNMVLKIVASRAEANDDRTNYLILAKNKTAKGEIIINRFKTDKEHESLDVVISKSLTNMLKKYLNTKKDDDKEYLFTDAKLTKYVSAMNKKMGLTGVGAINNFRHMTIEEFYENNPSAESRAELASVMKHSPATQVKYLRNRV